MTTHDDEPTDEEWKELTVVPEKQAVFSSDLYFRECWADVLELFGGEATKRPRSVAMLIVKPDAVVGRRMSRVLDFALMNGFIPIAVARIGMTRHSMREVWRYDWHVYPVDRLAFTTIWYTACHVLMFLFRDRRPHSALPGSVRLSQMKGHAIAARRRPDDLRTVLQPPNRILNFVHVAEEPVDVVREVGIFTDGAERRRLLQAVKDNYDADCRGAAAAAIAALEADYPAHDLDAALSLNRLQASGAITPEAGRELKTLIEEDKKICWKEICATINPHDTWVSLWDFICVASNLLDYERPARSELLPSVAVDKWLDSGKRG